MNWFKKRPHRINPEELHAKAEVSLKVTTSNQGRVNSLNAWLINRSAQNGFGDDIEITLKAKGA